MNIYGLQKLTLLDYPERVGATVFLGSCNFRCPFCQNRSLVLCPEKLPDISYQSFQSFLKKRTGLLDGICVTGGEPTLHKELPDFLAEIKSHGFLTKLDTNGTNPDMLRFLLENKLTDYIAMDIKAGRKNYAKVCGLSDTISPTILPKILESVELLKQTDLEHEFRTTVVKGLHTEEDFYDIREWIAGCERYYLQAFRDCEEILLDDHSFSAFEQPEMEAFLQIIKEKIPGAQLRGS